MPITTAGVALEPVLVLSRRMPPSLAPSTSTSLGHLSCRGGAVRDVAASAATASMAAIPASSESCEAVVDLSKRSTQARRVCLVCEVRCVAEKH